MISSSNPCPRFPISSLLASVVLLVLTGTAFGGTTEQIRADLDTILWLDQSIDAVTGRAAADSLAAARETLAGWTDEQLEVLVPHAASITTLKERTALLASSVLANAEAARTVREALRSPGLPAAEYFTDSLCTGMRFDTGNLKIAWNTYWAAQTAFLALEFVCQQDILGENTAAACVPLAIALGVAEQVIENYDFCDNDVDSSEIGASYLRLDHLHGDLEVAQEMLDSALVEQIQIDLARRRFYVAEFILPAASNGKLEVVRSVVVDVMTRMVAAGMFIRDAQAHLDLSDAYYAAGNWKRSYQELGFAYRAAVGGRK